MVKKYNNETEENSLEITHSLNTRILLFSMGFIGGKTAPGECLGILPKYILQGEYFRLFFMSKNVLKQQLNEAVVYEI